MHVPSVGLGASLVALLALSTTALVLKPARRHRSLLAMAATPPLSLTSRDPHAQMPVLGLGTWRSEKGAVKEAVAEALRVGYIHLDCAQVYENQEEVGEGIQQAIKDGSIKSLDDVWVTSKVWNTCHRKELVRPAVERILRELKLPKINQLLIHWPTHTKFLDAQTMWPKDESGAHLYDLEGSNVVTWQELEKAVEDGLVSTIGLSNFNEEECEEILKIARIKPVCNQVECHPYLPQDELRAYLHSKGIALVAYSPLANLDPNDATKPSVLRDEVILGLATKHGKSAAQIVLRWHLHKGNVVIPKSVTPSRIAENAAIFDFSLSEEDMAAIAELGKKHHLRLVNPGFKPGGKPVFDK